MTSKFSSLQTNFKLVKKGAHEGAQNILRYAQITHQM